jgi:cell division protein FtsQ
MDGGGRLLRSLGEFGINLAQAPFALASSVDSNALPVALPQAAPRLPLMHHRRRRAFPRSLLRLSRSPFFGPSLAFALIGAATLYGAVCGGAYAKFVADNGTLPDIVARAAGFPIKSVTISGAHELREVEILSLAGVRAQNSLVFLDVATIRQRLTAVPLIKEASVSKLFPNRLLIEIEERQPRALWQKNGVVSIVAGDGTPIDSLRNSRFERLPLVVGDSANKKLDDYFAVLAASGDLKARIRAGILVSERRWTLKMDNGVEIDLPERDPAAAIARFALLERDSHVLEKDIVSVDLRLLDRVAVRLTDEAAAARAAATASKKHKGAA